jgi:hypothetical protein
MAIQRFIPPMMGRGKGRIPQAIPAVNITVGKTARFHFNTAAILRYLGDKTCVEYFFDSEKGFIGFKFYKDKMPNTFTLTLTKVGTSATARVVASASTFIDYYGLRERLKIAHNRTFVLYVSDEDADLILGDISEVMHEKSDSEGT